MKYSVIWSKTLLYSLCRVKGVCRQIDNAVEKRVKIIPGLTAGLCDFKDTLCQTEKVISFIEQKKRTLNIAVMCGEIFEFMKPLFKKTLILKFSTFKSVDDCAKILKCSKRTYFRHIGEGICSFTKIREKMSLSDEYLQSIYGQDKWIMRFKEKAEEEEQVKQKIITIKQKRSSKLSA